MNDLVSTNQLRDDQDDFVNAIIESKGANLPATIEEIIPILAFSKAKADAFMALSDAAGKVKEQEELNQAALASGQRWGIVHLYGQKRLGEITSKIDPVRPITGGFGGGSKKSITPTKHQQLSVVGVPARTASDAERIAAHPEIMEKVIEDAKERGDIPTKGAVLSRIKAESYREKHPSFPAEKDDIGDVALTISNKLDELYLKLMQMWEFKDSIPKLYRDGIIHAVTQMYAIVTAGEEEDEYE